MKIFSTAAAALSIIGYASAQHVGTQKQEQHMPFALTTCTGPNKCQQQQLGITLDANWRWTHNTAGYSNCYDGNHWDPSFCPNEQACTQNCALDGVDSNDWRSPYGVTPISGGAQMNFVTHGPYSTNIGGRVYLVDASGEKYQMFKLKNREFTFDVDVSNMPCGLNGALYFVEMPADGGKSKYPTNEAGAKYGTGYCDAQCPHDIKWIHGEANMKDWKPSQSDKNAGKGHYGACCAEMDIWEANKMSSAYTAHPCGITGDLRCEGQACGDNDLGQRHQGVCDKDGCDINSFRNGVEDFYGPGSQFKVDTTRPFTVVT
jgi:cellulose 1,4-beta-cellobiosidase